MAKISTYVTDQNIVAADKWIGSDSQNNFQTKNFTAGDVDIFAIYFFFFIIDLPFS